MEMITFAIFLVIALVVAVGNKLQSPTGAVPGGFATTLSVAFLGAWVGSATLWHVGPDIAGVPVVASVVCSVIGVFFLSLLSGGHSHTWD